jgi:hypothetical protein
MKLHVSVTRYAISNQGAIAVTFEDFTTESNLHQVRKQFEDEGEKTTDEKTMAGRHMKYTKYLPHGLTNQTDVFVSHKSLDELLEIHKA